MNLSYEFLRPLLLFMVMVSSSIVHGQDKKEEENEIFNHHKVMLVIGHANVPAGLNTLGEKAWIVLPSWGLDYDYRFNERWSLGLHTDFVVENFEYHNSEDFSIERTRPLSLVLCGSRKFGKHLAIVLGGGAELAKEENLKLIRLGLDYGWELPKEWELAVSLMSDFKLEAYNSWVIGLGVAKLF